MSSKQIFPVSRGDTHGYIQVTFWILDNIALIEMIQIVMLCWLQVVFSSHQRKNYPQKFLHLMRNQCLRVSNRQQKWKSCRKVIFCLFFFFYNRLLPVLVTKKYNTLKNLTSQMLFAGHVIPNPVHFLRANLMHRNDPTVATQAVGHFPVIETTVLKRVYSQFS